MISVHVLQFQNIHHAAWSLIVNNVANRASKKAYKYFDDYIWDVCFEELEVHILNNVINSIR